MTGGNHHLRTRVVPNEHVLRLEVEDDVRESP